MNKKEKKMPFDNNFQNIQIRTYVHTYMQKCKGMNVYMMQGKYYTMMQTLIQQQQAGSSNGTSNSRSQSKRREQL